MADLGHFVRDLNATWLAGRLDDLARFFDERVVMLPPGGAPATTGVGPMVDSYRRFFEQATVHAFEVTGVDVFPFDAVTLCHARFTVDYELASERFQEDGLEVYAVDVTGPTPKVVWRTQLTFR